MGIVNTASGLGKTGLATLAYPFAAIGTGVRSGVASAIGAPTPTDTAVDAVTALGASGVGDLKASFNEDVAGLKSLAAGAFGLTPSAPPTVVGQPAKPAAPAAPAVTPTVAPTVTPTVTPPVTAAPVSPAAPAPVAPPRGDYSDLNMPELSRFGASATQPVAAPVAPTIKAPTLNADLMQQRQDLMTQIAAAQGVVQAGSNRDGYKMGDVTKALATMNALSPLVNSTGQLLSNTLGTEAGVLTHGMDNTARIGIADAGNQTEIAKTKMVTENATANREADAAAGIALADHKAALEASSPAGAKALMEAQLAEFKLQAALRGDLGAIMTLEGRQPARVDSVDPVSGRKMSQSTLDPKDVIQVQTEAPVDKKKGK